MSLASLRRVSTEPLLQALSIDKSRLTVLTSGVRWIFFAALHMCVTCSATTNSKHAVLRCEKLTAIRALKSICWVHAASCRMPLLGARVWKVLATEANILRIFLTSHLVRIPRGTAIVTTETPIRGRRHKGDTAKLAVEAVGRV
jgi:hypothetical protein